MSKSVRITPEPKTPPELRKLARAILMLVEREQQSPPKPAPRRRTS